MFADDLAYVKPLTDAEDIIDANRDLKALEEKYRSIGLSLNVKKTKAMRMNLKQPADDIKLSINGTNSYNEVDHNGNLEESPLFVWSDRSDDGKLF